MKMSTEMTKSNGESHELAVIEAEAREVFNASCYAAQSHWHNTNEAIHRTFQDSVEDNASNYRAALQTAQRTYRDTTADSYR
jgi:hypothetical protein